MQASLEGGATTVLVGSGGCRTQGHGQCLGKAADEEMETKHGTIEKYFSEVLGIDAIPQQILRDMCLQ